LPLVGAPDLSYDASRHNGGVEDLGAAGIGLDYGVVHLGRTTEGWLEVGAKLTSRVAEILDGAVAAVEPIGSSSVVGLLAKPIIDLVAGRTADHQLRTIRQRLEAEGWIYRGDAGDSGGHVFVLENRSWHRVAHLHVVEHEGPQWRNYLRFQDLLRHSSDARQLYEAEKLRLAHLHAEDRAAYTLGKTKVVTTLLSDDEASGADRT
jgi:GrpB-like predicted nucleotidyltransferase (UPF0157 family)